MSSPGLLLLHGFTGSPRSWDVFRAGLPAGTVVLAPALVGHAGSTSRASTFEAEVRRLLDLARSGGEPGTGSPRRWHVVGYSLGGRVALAMALADGADGPAVVDRLTLVGAREGLEEQAEREERRRADERWARLLEEQGLEAFVAEWSRQPLFGSQRALCADAGRRQRHIRSGQDAAGLARSLRVLGLGVMPYLGDRLADLRIPVRWVSGGLDDKFSAIGRRCAERSGGTFVAVPDVGHNVLLEAPEALRRIVLDPGGEPVPGPGSAEEFG